MSKNILIVDDSTIMRKMLVKVFEGAGHTVVGMASSGAESIELYKELNPDLVTMDITMRGMDGLTAAREIIAIDSSARVLILSNLDEDKYRDEVDRIGAIGLANKHNPDHILELVGE
ncbi:MAG: response regulator [Gammaproteobacteria bacterium]|nr:response regulator [Gammaproteobacteria bacterium]